MPRNPYLCLAIVVQLGLVALTSIVGIIGASMSGREASPSLVAIASACIGSLSSFLVSVPRGSAGMDDRNAQADRRATP